jgi:hypothetical protein
MNSLTLDFVLLAQKSLLEKPALLAAQKPPLWRKMFNGTALLLCEPKLYLWQEF